MVNKYDPSGKIQHREKISSMLSKIDYVMEPKTNLRCDCPYASHNPGNMISENVSQYSTLLKDGVWDAYCKGCGSKYDYMPSYSTADAGVYKVISNKNDGECSAPYADASYKYLTLGEEYTIVGSVINAYNHKWLQTKTGGWIYSGKLEWVRALDKPSKPTNLIMTRRADSTDTVTYADVSWSPSTNATSYEVQYTRSNLNGWWYTDNDYKVKTDNHYTTSLTYFELYSFHVRAVNESNGVKLSSDWVECPFDNRKAVCTNHVKGEFQWFWKEHPHYNCYKCSICGEIFPDKNEPQYVSDCTQCNPPAPTNVKC